MHSINFNLFPPSVYLKMHQMKCTAKVNGEGSVSCVSELLLIVPPGTPVSRWLDQTHSLRRLRGPQGALGSCSLHTNSV